MHGDLCGSLFAPASVALVGASENNFYARNALLRLEACGYAGEVHLVNPNHATVFGRVSHPDIASIGQPIELVFIAVPRNAVLGSLRSAVTHGARAAVVVTTGFGESRDGRGSALQTELGAFVAQHRIALCGPSCLGVINVPGHFQAFGGHQGTPILEGGVALVSQSGANVHSYVSAALARNLGFSYIASCGNEAGVEASEFIDFFLNDPATRVVCAYIESFKAPTRLVALAQKALRVGKPIIVLKIGLSRASARAALAHTGALTGPDHVFDTLFGQFGIVRAYSIEESLDRAVVFAGTPRNGWPRGPRAGVVSVSGGFAAAFTDLASTSGLTIPEFAPTSSARIRTILPAHVSPQNPIDISTQVQRDRPEAWRETIDAVAEDPATDFVLDAEAIPQTRARIDALVAARARTGKPILLASTSPHIRILDQDLLDLCRDLALPVTQGVEGTVRALDAVQRFLAAAARPAPAQPCAATPLPRPAHTVLHEVEARTHAGRFAERSAVKVVSRTIVHRSDHGLVRLGVPARDVAQVIESFESRADVDPEGRRFVVQDMVRGVAELLIGVSGEIRGLPVIVVSPGGVLVELSNDRVSLICPVDEAEALEMLQGLRSFPLLGGYRGGARADVEAAARTIASVSRFAIDAGDWLAEAEINPLVVLEEGRGVAAVDALIVARDDHGIRNA